MSASLPPDLRVLTRKLTSIPPAQLPHALPSLMRHAIRCKDSLAAPHDAKSKDSSSEASVLVHKLKTSVTTLLNGRSREGKFAAIALIKTIVDVGGWEILRGVQPWVQGLLAVVQKADPAASKELAIITLTRIYVALNPYQTLVRDIATPTVQAFVTACVQLIKGSQPDQASTSQLSLVEVACEAISTLIPLYPTTLRPLNSQIKNAVKAYLVPSKTQASFIPVSVRQAARRLVTSLHFTAAKSGGSEEWNKLVEALLKEFHATADQVLRPVDESWEPAGGQGRPRVDLDGEPKGGATDGFAAWSGTGDGVERMIGLFEYLSDTLRYTTKGAVTIPITLLMDAISRVCLIARLSPKTQSWDQSIQTNAAIGRDEREELWSYMPDIHMAALNLLLAIYERLDDNMVATVSETLDHITRVFISGISIATVRKTGYITLKQVLSVCGTTMSRPAVDMLNPLIGACCRDLQQHAGFLKQGDKPVTSTNDTNKNGIANADLFLKPQAANAEVTVSLEPDHLDAATSLLPVLLSHLTQQHLKARLRSLLEQTAIVTRNRDAMLASILHPFKDQQGRVNARILPHLTQLYPEDQGLEILRTNLRTPALRDGADPESAMEDIEEEDEDEEIAENGEDANQSEDADTKVPLTTESSVASALAATTKMDVDAASQKANPFSIGQEPSRPVPFHESKAVVSSPPKRKHDEADLNPSKRQEVESSRGKEQPRAAAVPSAAAGSEKVDEEDSDDESVHLNMELDDDEEDDE